MTRRHSITITGQEGVEAMESELVDGDSLATGEEQRPSSMGDAYAVLREQSELKREQYGEKTPNRGPVTLPSPDEVEAEIGELEERLKWLRKVRRFLAGMEDSK